MKALWQSLLADRFRLKVHWETRELPVYALVVEKNGPKFKENTGAPGPNMNTNSGSGKIQMTATKVSMALLAGNLGNRMGRIVLDKTGLNCLYDFALEWVPDQTPDSSGPSIFTGLQEQLGLKLESQRGQVEILVIDNAEKASEN